MVTSAWQRIGAPAQALQDLEPHSAAPETAEAMGEMARELEARAKEVAALGGQLASSEAVVQQQVRGAAPPNLPTPLLYHPPFTPTWCPGLGGMRGGGVAGAEGAEGGDAAIGLLGVRSLWHLQAHQSPA